MPAFAGIPAEALATPILFARERGNIDVPRLKEQRIFFEISGIYIRGA
jgi:hypothetical protein